MKIVVCWPSAAVLLSLLFAACRCDITECSGVVGSLVYDSNDLKNGFSAINLPCYGDNSRRCGVFLQEMRPPTLPYKFNTVCGLLCGTNGSAVGNVGAVLYQDAAFTVVTATKNHTASFQHTFPACSYVTWFSIDISAYNFIAYTDPVYLGFSVESLYTIHPVAMAADVTTTGNYHSSWVSSAGNSFSLLQPLANPAKKLHTLFVRGVGASINAETAGAPPFWTCNASQWDDGFCDCYCGFYDIDCHNLTNPSNCGVNQYCSPTLLSCVDPWFNCPANTWWDGETCNCDCGSALAADPDCLDKRWQYGAWDTPRLNVSGCRDIPAAYCDAVSFQCGILEYSCGYSTYNTSDGCNCECGSHDPDCDVKTQHTVGCLSNETCIADECGPIPVSSEEPHSHLTESSYHDDHHDSPVAIIAALVAAGAALCAAGAAVVGFVAYRRSHQPDNSVPSFVPSFVPPTDSQFTMEPMSMGGSMMMSGTGTGVPMMTMVVDQMGNPITDMSLLASGGMMQPGMMGIAMTTTVDPGIGSGVTDGTITTNVSTTESVMMVPPPSTAPPPSNLPPASTVDEEPDLEGYGGND